jgi:hypothetical protein
LRSVSIDGDLDLGFFRSEGRLVFEDCEFSGKIDLTHACFSELGMAFCRFGDTVWAIQLTVSGNVSLVGSSFMKGLVLSRASIDGIADLAGIMVGPGDASLKGDSLLLDEARIGARAALDESRIHGGLQLMGCRVESQLSLVSAQVSASHTTGVAISADEIEVGGGLMCAGLRCHGTLRLSGATVGGQVSLNKANLEAARTADLEAASLLAQGLTVESDFLGVNLETMGEVRLTGTSVGGQFSLAGATLDARTPGASALNADRMRVDGTANLRELNAIGEIRLIGAMLGGQLEMTGAQVDTSDTGSGDALSLDGLELRRSLVLDESHMRGIVRLPGARIGGTMWLNASRLWPGSGGDRCVAAEGCQISGSVQGQGLVARAQIMLMGATIDGQLDLSGSELMAPFDVTPPAPFLNINRAQIDGGLYLNGVRASGELQLESAKIGSQASLRGSLFENPARGPTHTRIVNGDKLEVVGPLSFAGSRIFGEVRLLGAVVGGQLSFDRAVCEARGSSDSPAISLDGAVLNSDLRCEGLRSNGVVRCLHVRIDGQLLMDRAVLEVTDGKGYALLGDGISIQRGMFCRNLRSHGILGLHGAKIDAQLSLINVTLSQGWAGSGSAVILTAAEIGELILAPRSVVGAVDLSHSTVRKLWDAEADAFVGELPQRLKLDGFHYDLREPLDAAKRLEWIAAAEENSNLPEIYGELANAFRRAGRASDAREVLIAGERRLRRRLKTFELRGLWQDMLWMTVGYGYRNRLALYWLVGLIATGAIAFSIERAQITSEEAQSPDFNAVLYSIDATVPILDLGQQSAWVANGSAAWTALLLSIGGYILATAVVAAATGLLSRERS